MSCLIFFVVRTRFLGFSASSPSRGRNPKEPKTTTKNETREKGNIVMTSFVLACFAIAIFVKYVTSIKAQQTLGGGVGPTRK